ncbi:major facilitator superfamily domain-containing protein [Hyaloraphidium curvatum]|nr:major facilitator superfamily domain-containing protein [Hyaloraphidium curvatum]
MPARGVSEEARDDEAGDGVAADTNIDGNGEERLAEAPKPEIAYAAPRNSAGIRHSPLLALAVAVIGTSTDAFAYSAFAPSLPVSLSAMGVTDPALVFGIMFALFGVGTLVASFVVGAVSDKYRARRPFLLLGVPLQVAGALLMGLAPAVWALYLSRLLQGFASACVWTAGLALVGDTFPGSEMGTATSAVLLGPNVGNVLGPVVGGQLYEKLGTWAPMACVLAACAVDLALRLAVQEPEHSPMALKLGFGALPWRKRTQPRDDVGPNPVQPPADPTRTPTPSPPRPPRFSWPLLHDPDPRPLRVFSDPCVLLISLLNLAAGAFLGVIWQAVPLRLSSPPFSLDPAPLSSILAVFPLAHIPGLLLAGWLLDHLGAAWVLVPGLVLSSILAPLLAIPSTLAPFAVTLALFSIASALPQAAPASELPTLLPPLAHARASALFAATFTLGTVIGPLLAGAVWGLPPGGMMPAMLVVCGIGGAGVLASAAYFWLKQDRKRAELAYGSGAEGTAPAGM